MSVDEQKVREAHGAFYEAVSDRDMDAMEEIWARKAPVSCIHPGWSLLLGRDMVLASWRSILEGPAAPEIAVSREAVHVYGDTAVVLCVESLVDGQLMATNVLIREPGGWKFVHHQAGPISMAIEFEDDDDEPPPGLLN